ncbi:MULTISPECIES: hypothetical protein [Catenuloplanes]|uniref:Uncharacterized protein n=1 Tax=Catenuloplanes niger TaxID=587534 RepID=A0AAE3ZY17_9ACTN|nr:hypothetical protein [Catenuloplanes niger]MDR7325905.1 hypothetical protein [Catenuloplanes niger]
MANAGDFRLVCADGRFIAVPGGVFYHDGPMAEPVDPAALAGALRAPRVAGAVAVFVPERARTRIGATDRVRRALDDLPAPARDRLVLGTPPGEAADQAAWLGLTDELGLARHAAYRPGLTPSRRVVPLDAAGLENPDHPAAVRVLPRDQAAARETVRAALDGTPPSWERLELLAVRSAAIRRELGLPPGHRGRSGAGYALAAGIALFGVPGGADPATLRRDVRQIPADEVLRAWGGPVAAVDAGELVAALAAAPGSGALVRVPAPGAGRPGLVWLVSRPGGLVSIDLEADDDAPIRVLTPRDAVSMLGTAPVAARVTPHGEANPQGETEPRGAAGPRGETEPRGETGPRVGPAAGGAVAPPDPADFTAAGMRALTGRIVARLGSGSGDVYCAAAIGVARDELFGRFGVALTPPDGRSRDDLDLHDGLWAGWGAPRTWPRTTGWAEIGRIVGEEPGRVAFVLSGRPGAIGHAFLVVSTADGVLWVDPSATREADRVRTHAEMTVPGRDGLPKAAGAVDLRTRIFRRDGTAVTVPVAPPESAGPDATALAMTDRADRRYRGSGVEDEESVMLFLPPGIVPNDARSQVLAWGPGHTYRIEVETKGFFLGADGLLYASPVDARAAGGDGRATTVAIIERVSGILRSHPHEVNRPAPEPVFDAFGRMAAKTRTLPGSDGGGPVMPLTEFLSGLDLDLEFTDLGLRTAVGRPPVRDEPGSHYHYTHGVVLSGMREFLEHVRDNTWRNLDLGYLTQEHLTDGLRFGDQLAEWFLEDGPEASGTANLIAGYAALFYDSFAGAATWPIYAGLNKVEIAVLSRVDAFADILERMPMDVVEFFGENWDRIWAELQFSIGARIPDYTTRYRARNHDERFFFKDDFRHALTHGRLHTLEEYARSAFVLDAERVTQWDAIGYTTAAPLDLAGGALLREHVPVEVRSYVARRITARRAQQLNGELSRRAAAAYDAALAVGPAERAAGARAWLSPVADTELRWGSPYGRPSAAVRRLEATAAARGRQMVALDGAGEEAATELSYLLRDEPGLAGSALFWVPLLDRALNDVRQAHRLNMIYPVITRLPGTLGAANPVAARYWRVVTFDNRVIELGEGDLTPDRLGAALDRLDTLARAVPQPERVPTPALTTAELTTLFRDVVASGRRLARHTGDRTVAECLALVKSLMGRLHRAGVRVPRTREEPLPGTWLGDRQDWERFGGWESLAGDPRFTPGSTAVVLTERAGAPHGHVYAAYRTADQGVRWVNLTDRGGKPRAGRPGETPADFDADTYTRMIVIGPDGVVVPAPERPEPESRSRTASLLDPPVSKGYRGSGVEDEETVMLFLGEGQDLSTLRGALLAVGTYGGFRVETDTKTVYRGADGRYYIDRADAIAAGGDGRGVTTAIIERVSGIMRSHPHEFQRDDPDWVFDAFARMAEQTAKLPGPYGAGPVMSLHEFLARSGVDVTLTPLGADVSVGRPPVGEAPGSHYHFTHGVVLSGMRDFLEHVRDHTWRDQDHGYLTRDHLTDGLAFGDRLAADFLAATGGPEAAATAKLVAGYAALFYDNFAGVATWPVSEHGLNKVQIAVLSRVDAFADLLDRLPAEAVTFLGERWGTIWERLEASVRARIPDYDERLRATGRAPEWTVGNFHLVPTHRSFTLQQYAKSAFVAGAERVTQSQAIDFTTEAPLDLADGALLIEHVPVEVRSYGARRLTAGQARYWNEQLTRQANRAYEAELALPAAVRARRGTAWLAGAPEPGVRWLSAQPGTPDWAGALGRTATRMRHPLVVVDVADGTDMAAARLSALLAAEPELAGTALFVAPSYDGGLNDLRRAYGLNIVYPIEVEQPDTGAVDAYWRLVTFDNRVTYLGAGAFTARTLIIAMDGADTAAHAGLAVSGDVEVRRVEVAYTAPPVPPPLLAPQNPVAELRAHVDAATERVTEVVNRFPHSVAAELVRTALERLRSAERQPPTDDDVTDLRFLLDQAAAEVLRLDPGAEPVLRPLWSGRHRAARPLPPPRSIGPWTAGDLGELTAGVRRPVLTVDLSGRTPAALDELERALRAHEWWGEVPIVVATVGNGVTNDAFAALRERFRPVVVQAEAIVGMDFRMVWRLSGPDGTQVMQRPGLTATLFEEAARLPAAPRGAALPPVLAGLLTAGDGAAEYHRGNAAELSDPGVRDALDRLIATAPDGERLAGFRVALGLDGTATHRLAPAVRSLLDVEPPYTGGPVPASFAYDFLALAGAGRRERFALDGLLFQIALAGRMTPDAVLDLVRAGARTAVDRAVAVVFEAVTEVMALTDEQAARDPGTDPVLRAVLAKVRKVSDTTRPPGAPPPDCLDPVDRAAFVGRLDGLRDLLRGTGRPARAALIETLTHTLSNC